MCYPNVQDAEEICITDFLLPNAELVVPVVPEITPESAEVTQMPSASPHVAESLSSSQAQLHPDDRVIECTETRQEPDPSSSNISDEVTDLQVKESLASESTNWNWTEEGTVDNNQGRWSTGVNGPQEPMYNIIENFQAMELQNNGNSIMAPTCRVLPFHQQQQQQQQQGMGSAGYSVHRPNGNGVPAFRLVPVDNMGPPSMQIAPGSQLSLPSYGNGAPTGGSWLVANSSGIIIGQVAQPYGHQQQASMNPLPYYGEGPGPSQFIENRPANCYQGHQGPPIVYLANQPVSSAYCQPTFVDIPTASPFISSQMQWGNSLFYNQGSEIARFLPVSQGSDTWTESSTGLDSYWSESSEDSYLPTNLPLVPSATYSDRIEAPRFNAGWNEVNNPGAPVIWANHPTDINDSNYVQSPVRQQDGSDFYSSDSNSFYSTGYSSNDSSQFSSPVSSSSQDGIEICGQMNDSKSDGNLEETSSSYNRTVDTLSSNSSETYARRCKSSTNKTKKKSELQPRITINAGIRSPMYLIDRGTTFYMNGEELPYVINTWDGALSSKMNPKPPNFEYYVPPMMNDEDFFGGQQQMWQMKMMQYFGKCRPDIWRLQAVPDFQKSPTENWIHFTITTKLRFCCRECKIPWTSKKGKVVYAFSLDFSKRHGCIFMKMFGQVCMRNECSDWNFQTPACYPEEIDRATYKLFEYISFVYYGIPLDPFIFTECEKSIRIGNPKSHHRKELCQACKQGICKQNR